MQLIHLQLVLSCGNQIDGQWPSQHASTWAYLGLIYNLTVVPHMHREPFAGAPTTPGSSPAVAASSPSGKPAAPHGGEEAPAGWGTQLGAGHLFEEKEKEDLDRKAKQGFTPQLVMGVGSRMFPAADSPK